LYVFLAFNLTLANKHSISIIISTLFVICFGVYSSKNPRLGKVETEENGDLTEQQDDLVEAKSSTNILFIMADDLGYNHLGVYGQQKIKTPNIDQLASEGMRFNQFYAGANVCGPSRATIMLGIHTGHLPYRDNRDNHLVREHNRLGELTILSELLRKKGGYQIGYFGKYGIGGPENISNGLKPNDIGFNEFWGLLEHGHGHFHFPAYIWHNKEKISLSNTTRSGNAEFGLSSRDINERREHTDDVFSEKAIEFIKESAKKDRPFFCYLSFSLPHTEMLPREEFAEEYRKKGWGEYNSIDNGYHVPTDTPKANFAGMISQVDYWTGQAMKALEESGVSDNTLVIFTSDNGGQLRETWGDVPSHFFEANGPLRKGKEWNYEGGIRVPMIARWPGKIAPGSMSNHIGYFPDLMPTFAQVADVPESVPEYVDGISLLPELTGKQMEQKQHEYLYWERPNYENKGGYLQVHPTIWRQAIRFGKWKALRETTNSPVELYNLEDDLGEHNNLASEYPELVNKAIQIMEEARYEPMDLPN